MQRKKKPQIGFHIIGVLIVAVCVIPFLLVVSASLTKPIDLVDYGFRLIPLRVDWSAYEAIFENPELILRSYLVTIVATVGTVVGGLFVMSAGAYTLARPNCVFRKGLTFYFFFTMLFSGGLVPYYILITRYLKLRNTITVMIVPSLVNVYYLLMIRTFMQKLPSSLFESAKIDGASEMRIFFKIALPLSTPSLATVGFFTAMAKWNDWTTGLYFIDDRKLYPLQFLLQTIQKDIQSLLMLLNMGVNTGMSAADVPGDNLLMAMAVVAVGPMLVIFPLFQKYFVQGLTLGAVKG